MFLFNILLTTTYDTAMQTFQTDKYFMVGIDNIKLYFIFFHYLNLKIDINETLKYVLIILK